MWTAWELSELQGTLRDIKLEDVLTEDEIMIIKDNSTRYMNLKNEIKVPKHKDKVKQTFLSYDKFNYQVKTILLKQIDGGIYMDMWVC